jgi:hypothetical protein
MRELFFPEERRHEFTSEPWDGASFRHFRNPEDRLPGALPAGEPIFTHVDCFEERLQLLGGVTEIAPAVREWQAWNPTGGRGTESKWRSVPETQYCTGSEAFAGWQGFSRARTSLIARPWRSGGR